MDEGNFTFGLANCTRWLPGRATVPMMMNLAHFEPMWNDMNYWVTVANAPVVCLNVLYSKTLTSFLILTDVGMKFPEGINNLHWWVCPTIKLGSPLRVGLVFHPYTCWWNPKWHLVNCSWVAQGSRAHLAVIGTTIGQVTIQYGLLVSSISSPLYRDWGAMWVEWHDSVEPVTWRCYSPNDDNLSSLWTDVKRHEPLSDCI